MQHLELRVPPVVQVALAAMLIWISGLQADITEITFDNFDSGVLHAEGSLLVYFYAP